MRKTVKMLPFTLAAGLALAMPMVAFAEGGIVEEGVTEETHEDGGFDGGFETMPADEAVGVIDGAPADEEGAAEDDGEIPHAVEVIDTALEGGPEDGEGEAHITGGGAIFGVTDETGGGPEGLPVEIMTDVDGTVFELGGVPAGSGDGSDTCIPILLQKMPVLCE